MVNQKISFVQFLFVKSLFRFKNTFGEFRFFDLKKDLERVLWSTNPFIKNKKFSSQNTPPGT